jgi:hypothetical protein
LGEKYEKGKRKKGENAIEKGRKMERKRKRKEERGKKLEKGK